MNYTNLLSDANGKTKPGSGDKKTQQSGVKGNERNIPLSEGFEICFCLIVSEREKEKRA